jgi:ParB family chromosome partitioning protein
MTAEDVHEIEIARLDPNPFQARIEYREEELRDLGVSIKQHGMLQPILVRPSPTQPRRYQICAGERRVRACQFMGITTALVIVKDLSDKEMALYALVENLQRRNLNPVEQARGFKNLLEQSGWSQEKMAQEVGCGLTRDIIAQSLRLLTFPPELQELVSHDTITPTHAEALARLISEPSTLKEAICKVVNEKLTTKQTEQLIGELIQKKALQREILEYLTSEEFLPLIEYIFTTSIIGGDETYCPFGCGNTVTYEELEDANGRCTSQRMVCKKCGWFCNLIDDSLSKLAKRIKELHRDRNQPPPQSEETRN